MQPENLNFGDLIHRRAPFVIPPYQRAYAWENEEIDDFIKDINALYARRKSGNSDQHFFGGLVTVNSFMPGTYTGGQYVVIDGQQRLATFSMLLALIVRELEKVSKQSKGAAIQERALAHAKNIKSKYLEYEVVSEGRVQNKPRVVLSKADHNFLEELLWGKRSPTPARESHKRLKRAWNRLSKGLVKGQFDQNVPFENQIEYLLTLEQVVTDGCYMIHIVSTNKSEAYQLFMTLNDRGKSLSAGDLLRSHTLELLEGYEEEQQDAESNWDKILQDKEKRVEDFLRAYLPSQKGKRAGRLTLYDDFCQSFFDSADAVSPQKISPQNARQIRNEITEMVDEYDTFSKIARGDWAYNDTSASLWEKDRLGRLVKILKHKLCYPLLLAVKHSLPERKFVAIVQILERFIFRYVTICKVHPGKLADKYYTHCMKIRKAEDAYSIDELRTDLRTLLEEDAPISFFKNSLTERLQYVPSMSPMILHFLSTLEDYRDWYDLGAKDIPRHNSVGVFDISALEIEHIYPQTPRVVDQDLEPLKHDLGNLSFWSPKDNKSAQNADFATKKASYSNSNVSLNRDLGCLQLWDARQIHERREKLIDMAVKIFTV